MTHPIPSLRQWTRSLARAPYFTATVLLTLTVTVAAGTAIYTVVDRVLLSPLPYPDPGGLYDVAFSAPAIGFLDVPFSDAFYVHMTEGETPFADLALHDDDAVVVTGGGAPPARVEGAVVTPNFFRTLGHDLALGAGFRPEHGRPGAARVVILSHDFWGQRYGSDPALVGSDIIVNGEAHEVVGVAGRRLGVPVEGFQLFRPIVLDPATLQAGNLRYRAVGRLLEGELAAHADAEMAARLRTVEEAYPGHLPVGIIEEAGFTPVITSLREKVVGPISRTLWVLLAAAVLVFLLACVNITNLVLVRSEARAHTLALRRAMGAGRAHIAGIVIGETVLLATAGALAGLLLGEWSVRLLRSAAPDFLPRLDEIGIGADVALVVLLVTVAGGIAFGGVAFLRQSRLHLASALHSGGGRGGGRSGATRFREATVIAQVGLAVLLVVGAGLMARTLMAASAVQLGFEPAGAAVLQVSLPEAEYDPDRRLRFWQESLDRIRGIGGVSQAAVTEFLPLAEKFQNESIEIEGHAVDDGSLPPMAEKTRVSAGYFVALGIDLLEGRSFAEGDGTDGFLAAIVNESFADRWWPAESALGKRIREDDSEDWYQVVGVVEDVRYRSIMEAGGPAVYYPVDAHTTGGVRVVPSTSWYVVRGDGTTDPGALLAPVRAAIWDLDPNLAIASSATMESRVRASLGRVGFTAWTLAAAAALALLLSAIGTYGLVAYTVARRTPELAVRMALGAAPRTVTWSVVRRALALCTLGLLVGIAAAYWSSSLLARLMFGVERLDWPTYLAAATLLLAVTIAASYLPARRVAGIEPGSVLHSE